MPMPKAISDESGHTGRCKSWQMVEMEAAAGSTPCLRVAIQVVVNLLPHTRNYRIHRAMHRFRQEVCPHHLACKGAGDNLL
jgi:hypothetical protein